MSGFAFVMSAFGGKDRDPLDRYDLADATTIH